MFQIPGGALSPVTAVPALTLGAISATKYCGRTLNVIAAQASPNTICSKFTGCKGDY
jgi:hypothetical protein